MRLAAWFKLTKTKRTVFAGKIDVSAVSVTRIERGTQNITLATVHKIFEATGEAVTPNDLHAAYVEARDRAA